MSGIQYTNMHSSCPVYNLQISIRVVRCTIYNQAFEYNILIFEMSGVQYTNKYYNIV